MPLNELPSGADTDGFPNARFAMQAILLMRLLRTNRSNAELTGDSRQLAEIDRDIAALRAEMSERARAVLQS